MPEIMTCGACSAKYEVVKKDLPFRDRDSIECDCGEELLSWNGGVCYIAIRLKD
ncbi:hypothetical protein [Geothrix sp. 21YS21S-4]|uniref:hypothetical protein n=1 Tax=Geothrix sp. 21YS21S-4 TaxID=3068889 RepID=UPI0027B987F7|nr:hypothetical protein [Geothrix sp. 21YS21S-4]